VSETSEVEEGTAAAGAQSLIVDNDTKLFDMSSDRYKNNTNSKKSVKKHPNVIEPQVEIFPCDNNHNNIQTMKHHKDNTLSAVQPEMLVDEEDMNLTNVMNEDDIRHDVMSLVDEYDNNLIIDAISNAISKDIKKHTNTNVIDEMLINNGRNDVMSHNDNNDDDDDNSNTINFSIDDMSHDESIITQDNLGGIGNDQSDTYNSLSQQLKKELSSQWIQGVQRSIIGGSVRSSSRYGDSQRVGAMSGIDKLCWKVSKIIPISSEDLSNPSPPCVSISVSGPDATDLVIENSISRRTKALLATDKKIVSLDISSCPLKNASAAIGLKSDEHSWMQDVEHFVLSTTLVKTIDCANSINYFSNIISLNLSNNYLESFRGDLILPLLVTLDISHNNFSTLNHLYMLTNLRSLNASCNKLESIEKSVARLISIGKQLKSLNLIGNKICEEVPYPSTVSQIFPNLSYFDGVDVISLSGKYSYQKSKNAPDISSKAIIKASFPSNSINDSKQRQIHTPLKSLSESNDNQSLSNNENMHLPSNVPSTFSPNLSKRELQKPHQLSRSIVINPSADIRENDQVRNFRLKRAFEKSSTTFSSNIQSSAEVDTSLRGRTFSLTSQGYRSRSFSMDSPKANTPKYMQPTKSYELRSSSPRESRPSFMLRSDEWHPMYYSSLRNTPLQSYYDKKQMASCNRLPVSDRKSTLNMSGMSSSFEKRANVSVKAQMQAQVSGSIGELSHGIRSPVADSKGEPHRRKKSIKHIDAHSHVSLDESTGISNDQSHDIARKDKISSPQFKKKPDLYNKNTPIKIEIDDTAKTHPSADKNVEPDGYHSPNNRVTPAMHHLPSSTIKNADQSNGLHELANSMSE
jgi:hypothetical protein